MSVIAATVLKRRPNPSPMSMNQNVSPRTIALAAAIGSACVIACFILRVRLGTLGDLFAFTNHFRARFLLPGLVAAAIVAIGIALSNRWFARAPRITLLAWIVAGVCVQLVLRHHYLHLSTLHEVIVSAGANSFYTATLKAGPLEFLSTFPDIRSTLPGHVNSNMPGKVMLFYLLRFFTDSPSAMAVMIMVLSNLGAVFLFVAVRDLFGDRTVALYSAILYLLIPGKIYFFPILNTLSPAVILLCFMMFTRWLTTGNLAWAGGLGAMLYMTIFFEPLPMVMGLLFAAFLLTAIAQGRTTWHAATKMGASLLLGFAAVSAVMRLLFGYDLLESFVHAYTDAHAYNVRAGRSYSDWLFLNLFEFGLAVGGAGVAVTALAAWQVLPSRTVPWREWLSRPVAVWAVGVFAVLAFLVVFAINRGEVTRLWLFVAAFMVVLPAYACAQTRSPAVICWLAACLLLETAAGMATVAFVMV